MVADCNSNVYLLINPFGKYINICQLDEMISEDLLSKLFFSYIPLVDQPVVAALDFLSDNLIVVGCLSVVVLLVLLDHHCPFFKFLTWSRVK